MEREVTKKVKSILNNAMKLGIEYEDSHTRPEHFILSLINDNNNLVISIFKMLQVDIDNLFEDLTIRLNESDLNPRIMNVKRSKLPLGKDMKIIFNKVDYESEKLNDNHVGTIHVLLAMLSMNTNLTINSIFSKNGIDYNNFKHMVNKSKNSSEGIKNMIDDNDEPLENHGGPNKSKKQIPNKQISRTPVLDNFCMDVTKSANEGRIDPVVGREAEVKRLTQILSRRKKNNPVLIGEPGVGKSAIVDGLALMISNGSAPRVLLNKRILAFDLTSIVAGTKYRGQFEERMKAIVEELRNDPDTILFIDELHTMVGAGNASGSLDASNIFKPALARGDIQIIGATTINEFRENIEKDGALTRRFQQILVEQPTLDETLIILKNLKSTYENHHKVIYTNEAIELCVSMSDRYIMERAMPDKAIDVMDEAGANANINQKAPLKIKTLEAQRESIITEKKNVVATQNYEEAAKLRDQETKINTELAEHKEMWLKSMDENRATVTAEIISEVVSVMTGIPLTKINLKETRALVNMEADIKRNVIGQDEAVEKVSQAIKRGRLGIKDKNRPSSFIFLGQTGVGKCFLSDTQIVIRNKTTNLVEKIDINELMKRIKH